LIFFNEKLILANLLCTSGFKMSITDAMALFGSGLLIIKAKSSLPDAAAHSLSLFFNYISLVVYY
jgi:hypothetical protein